ncbi:MAG TPA: hypothetical protein VFZ09_40320 [Archangium sp.]|uniref:hypothetical protein n=1 Tax=Archangium sp. TaxID=1872627 RepID=UPI002E380580|nr:hypothetical protein [Archangium sp.]HEX5752521.1 hypothetical protein [Archangium sp.]
MTRRAMLAAVMGLLILGTGCPDVYGKGGKLDQAMAKDIQDMQEERRRELRERREDMEDDEGQHCPEGKMEVRDCTSYPCKVECQ